VEARLLAQRIEPRIYSDGGKIEAIAIAIGMLGRHQVHLSKNVWFNEPILAGRFGSLAGFSPSGCGKEIRTRPSRVPREHDNGEIAPARRFAGSQVNSTSGYLLVRP
jgi:hypothetical protein